MDDLEWAEMALSVAMETWPVWDETTCHCGEPVRYGFDGDPTHTRGMCGHCDSIRCDAYPGECGR